MEFSPRQSTSVNVDSEEFFGSPFSPLAIDCPLEDCFADREKLLRRDSSGRRHSSTPSDTRQVELSVIALVLAAFKRTRLTCQGPPDDIKMDIGWPTDVRHVTHVTFDRFNGFLGLPVEFELEIPRRVPSASASVFGVSAESMQCSYDRNGNSVPTILLLLQERLYDQGGLKAEGVFRINAENSQEEHVRDQLNKGIVPEDIDVHCLAGLIKAWFRELPKGVLDNLTPDQVMQCHTEEQCLTLIRTLPPTEAALLNWAINLMADVVQEEEFNKMNARNLAMVFAPNMTQMTDPLTALMHAVQVMNLLKTLILKTLKDRQEAVLDPKPASSCSEPPSGNGHNNTTQEPGLGIEGRTDLTEGKYAIGRDGCFLKTFNERESIEEYESARDSDEMFLRDSGSKQTTDEDDLSTDSRGQFSNGSSVMDNTDEDSHGMDSYTSTDGSKLSCSNVDIASTSTKASPCCNGETQYIGNGLIGREKNRIASEVYEIKSIEQCVALESLPSEDKSKGGVLVGKFDRQSDNVEAW